MITSTNNVQIKNIIQLQKKQKVRTEQRAYVIEGIKMFLEAKKLNLLIKTFVSNRFFEEIEDANLEYLQGVDYELVEDKVFGHMADTVNPQGIMAIVKMPQYTIEQIIEQSHSSLIILEDLRDPGNLGTIVRTAEAAGVTGIIMSRETVDIFNPKVIRSTMGSVYRLPFIYVDDFIETIKQLKRNDYVLYATHLSGTNYYDEVEYSVRSGIIIGNEAHGISMETKEEADQLVKIPMCGEVESLNAAIAAAIMMYERYKQRRKH